MNNSSVCIPEIFTASPAPYTPENSFAPSFIQSDFLLQTRFARQLYHDYAEGMPIIDFHSHLPAKEIAKNKQYSNITQLWLKGDHYKWRAMRTNGINEDRITGNASDRDKFQAWAETVPFTLRNPLYHWTHLELSFPFGIRKTLLNASSADMIYNECNTMLQKEEFSARGLLKQYKVEILCTTDDPTDTLAEHIAIRNDPACAVKVYPTFRPDKAMNLENNADFNAWIDRLEQSTDMEIRNISSLTDALKKRHDFFHDLGCRLSDHGLETAFAEAYNHSTVAICFERARAGKPVSHDEAMQYKSYLLEFFGKLNHSRGWTMQLHFGAMRNNNTAMYKKLGPDTGYDSIVDIPQARNIARYMDNLQQQNALPKTIIYNLNPSDNEALATLIGCFQDGTVPGKIQLGSGWWFLDQKEGMEKQMNALSNMGLLSRFVGMLTDSRCFLSFSRHEYFRRILCNLIGRDVESGELPMDMALLGGMVRDICYNNAKNYFGFPA
ncbi:MAG: glucuronate isomerase [Fibrobacteres bacterium]|nr:glucuronate isomerase [Fibrobacterota bacterium]